MNETQEIQNGALPGSLTYLVHSLAAIVAGQIDASEMLCRLFLIENASGGVGLKVDRKNAYLHVARTAFREAAGGSNSGLDSLRTALEEAYGFVPGSLKQEDIEKLEARLPKELPVLEFE